MTTFRYEARNADAQIVAGELEAASLSQAGAQLEGQGLIVLSLVAVESATVESPFAEVPPEETSLDAELAFVVERARSIVPALRAYAAELPAGKRRQELEQIIAIVDSGDAAAATQTLLKYPTYWFPLLGATRSQRDPAQVLSEFFAEADQANRLRRQWYVSLAYPALICALALVVMALLSLFVIPIFQDIFNGFGLQLPGLTKGVLAMASLFALQRMILLAISLVIAGLLIWQLPRLLPTWLREGFADWWARWFGRSNGLARLCGFTADLLEAELSPATALRVAGNGLGSCALQRAALRGATALHRHSDSAENIDLLSAGVWHALTAPLEVQQRVSLLREIGHCFADRARLRLSWGRGIIEPLAILSIGLLVGIVALALLLPLIKLMNGLA